MNEYMLAQKKKIEIEKWCEGVRRQSDPGTDFIIWWILTYGAAFRKAWENSLCSKCCQNHICGYEVRKACNGFNHRKTN